MSSPLQRTALRGRQAAHVPEFAEHGGGRDRADAVLAHQGLTTGLPARQALELALERHELAVDLIDDRQRDLDRLQGTRGATRACAGTRARWPAATGREH